MMALSSRAKEASSPGESAPFPDPADAGEYAVDYTPRAMRGPFSGSQTGSLASSGIFGGAG